MTTLNAPDPLRKAIETRLKAFASGSLHDNAVGLLNALGYKSDKTLRLEPNTATEFQSTYGPLPAKALTAQWKSVDLLFQVTDDEIKEFLAGTKHKEQASLGFSSVSSIKGTLIQSFLFFAVELNGASYSRTQLADATREVNKLFPMPVIILFRHNGTLTLSIIDRRMHKRDSSKDVLEKVTLIKDIRIGNPHRAHIEILRDLALSELTGTYPVHNFFELQAAWRKTLDTSALNKKFYEELADWYFWALQNVTFPAQENMDGATNRATNVIRLITRLMFTWFLKERGLVPDTLFREAALKSLLTDLSDTESTYYKAILQNLFFATLNTEMDDSNAPRKFRSKNTSGGSDGNYMAHTVYRYAEFFHDKNEAVNAFAKIPFLNGGLFECLDKTDENGKAVRIDGFSDRTDNVLSVPNFLFFGTERTVTLTDYDKPKIAKVRGLIHLLDRYKFTVAENTPIEEEIALDPELLGKVFENLLASYNPETGATARKQTGSFYTPREIVNYMVDEALIAALETHLQDRPNANARLRHLFAYNEEPHSFTKAEAFTLVDAIDGLKILDPACGSGAFPMGILQKLVFVLGKLDPKNEQWRDRQIAKAGMIDDPDAREHAIADIEQAFANNDLDYGRKLYLINSCIYGVDIQPVAMQIAKLRFFISLLVDQRVSDGAKNRGVRPLPNLETKLVAANTLIGVERPAQDSIPDPEIETKERELKAVRDRHFSARTPATKTKCRAEDKRLRTELCELLEESGFRPAVAKQLSRWDPYDASATARFFDPEWMFGVTSGFDITIGNPPYVRADSGEDHLALRDAIVNTKQYETLWEKWDLFIPFIERGYKLLKPDGVTTMIVSDAYCHSKYAEKSQKWFLKNSRINRLDFFSNVKIFEAAVHNVIYFFQRAEGAGNEPERRVHNPDFETVTLLPTAPQAELTLRAFFPEDGKAEAPKNPTITLDRLCYISVGMVVHAHEDMNEGIYKGTFVLEDLISEYKDAKHCKPFVQGKDLAKWLPASQNWLEWDTERAPSRFRRKTFPELYSVREKLFILRIGGAELRTCYDESQLLTNHTTIVAAPWFALKGVRNTSLKKVARYQGEKPVRTDLPRREELEKGSCAYSVKYTLAILNSSYATQFLRANRRSNTDIYPDDWKKLPVPEATPEQQQPIIEIVDAILAAKRQNPAADVSQSEAQLDEMVNALYGIAAIPSEAAGV